MESQRETRRRSSKAASTPATPTPVRRRSARHAVEVQEKQENVVFAPSDPYSAAMDDMPLKDLFPNMKVRKRPTPKKVEVTEVSSPKNIESDESVRSKLRESLTSALKKIENVEWEHERGQDLKTDRENIEQTVSNNAAMKTEGQAKDQVMSDAELSEHALVKDNVEANIGIPESLEKLGRSLREERRDYIDNAGAPSKKVKLEFISDKTGDGRTQSETSDLAERVAFEIEAEMYRHFGGVNKKYKEKARSLLFNLKDRLNPELRLRVLAGEITPENLCSMTAEQLASKELSEWRMAKAEELAQMVVLTEADTEQTRLVKKTHKGEIELGFEKDDLFTDVVTVGSEQRIALLTQQQEREGTPVNAELDVQNDNVETTNDEILEEEIEVLNFSESPIRELDLADGISDAPSHFEELLPQRAEELSTSSQQEEESRSLPVKLSLDEFLGSKKVKEPNMSVKDDELDLKLGLNEMKASSGFTPNEVVNVPFPISVKDKLPRKPLEGPNHKSAEPASSKTGILFQKDRKKDHRLNEKLWEGSFQLSGSQISPVIAIFRSGDAVELQSWPKLIEIKGRVRLDALEKFLQELRLSRTRAVMVIACRVDGDEHVGAMNSLKEAAYQYQRGERVGYAEPVAGYELYLFPGGGSSLKLLIEHGYLNTHQVSSDEDDILIGFVVCRRSAPSGNVSHKTSHYFNANRHAISAQLDSPTRPSEIPSAGNVIKALPISSVSSKETDSYSAPLSFISTQAVSAPINIGESKVRPSLQPLGQEPGELVSLLSQPTQLVRPAQSGVSWMRKESVKDEDLDDDLPPGFGPKAWTRSKHSVPDDEDDDLPEYDFSTHNPPPVLTTMKSDVGLVPPFSVQTSYVQSSVFHPLSQGSQAPPGFEQQLNSQFFRPAIANATVPLDQARPPLPSSSQASQPLPFLPLGPRPPPGPPPGPSTPFTTFLPRPQLQSDGVIGARMPVSPQVPIALQVPVVNVLPGEGSFNLPQARPTSSQFYDESRRPPISFLQNHPVPISQAPPGAVRRRGGSQGNSLWDDDDMPEWCPPGISQQADNIQTPSHLPLQSAESGPGSAPRGMGPLIGGGWQGMQAPVAVPLQGEGRGILQAPPPVMRFPVPVGGNGSHFPFVRPEKFPSDRPGTRLPEPRIFKSGK